MIHPKLESYIATRDRKIAKFWPHEPNCLRNQFIEMMQRGTIRVGGRSTCGGSDPTMHAYRAWNEVIRKARSLGYSITVTDCSQQGNAWATRGGGFWNESEYRIDAAMQDRRSRAGRRPFS